MKSTTLGVFVLAVFVAGTGTAAAQVNKPAVQTSIIANEKAINDAIVKGDLKTFHSFLAPEAIDVEDSGVKKLPDIDKMLADVKISSYTITADQFLWLDDTNVVHTYKWFGKMTYKGEAGPGDTFATTIWSNRGGKWLAVYHQETMVPPPPAARPAAAAKPASPK